jgi:hypothetical protein
MKSKFWTFIVISILFVPSLVFAGKEKVELTLYKVPLFEEPFNFYSTRTGCNSLYSVDGGKNYTTLSDFVYFYCDGGYTFTLDGPANTTVTLFGNPDYRVDWGYLIVRKTNDKRIWLKDLNSLKKGGWQTVEGEGGYGDYQYYYKKSPAFIEKIASVKWGQWWNSLN